jgi:hypothetical protein
MNKIESYSKYRYIIKKKWLLPGISFRIPTSKSTSLLRMKITKMIRHMLRREEMSQPDFFRTPEGSAIQTK